MERRASLRNKITTAIVLVILFLGLTVIFAINQILPKALKDEAKKRGLLMARNLAGYSSKPFLSKDLAELKRLVNEEKALSDDIAFVLIANRLGSVLAHTFESQEQIPPQMMRPHEKLSPQGGRVQLLDTPEGMIYEISAPILSHGLAVGVVKIGLKRKNILRVINNVLGIAAVVTLLTIILSIFIGSGLAGLIVRPVNRLRLATEKMTGGNLDVRVDIKTGDEIQELATSFNEMAAKLKESYADLLERHRELDRQRKALEKSNKVKSDFLAVMSHELRTPLTAIIGFSEMMVEGVQGELKEEQRETLKEVLGNAKDLLSMINSMLGLADIETGRMKLDIETYDLRETLKRVCRTMSPLAQDKQLNLDVDVPEGLPLVEGDERKIQQAVLNLMANAAKFTPEKGRIRLKATHFGSWNELEGATAVRHRFDHPERTFSNGGFKVVVEDSGMGISKEQCAKIFDMFYQVDGTSTRSFGGIGLGLAIARQFVEMHGGRIWVESELGQGARFTILIPCTLV